MLCTSHRLGPLSLSLCYVSVIPRYYTKVCQLSTNTYATVSQNTGVLLLTHPFLENSQDT